MKRNFRVLFSILFAVIFVLGFGKRNNNDEDDKEDSVPLKVDPNYIDLSNHWIDSVYNSLSLKERVAQLMVVAAYSNRGEDHEKEIEKLIEQHKIGGLIFFQGGPVRQAQMTNHFQSVSSTPLLISMDAEWGLSMRLDSTFKYPKQMMLGAIKDNQLVYKMGADMASQLRRLGVHMNFAPVIDVNNNPNNPVINIRSFGEERKNVSTKGLAYMMGLQDNLVLATAKHFPGHGDTDTDSHHALPVINHPKERLDAIELYPFKNLINAGLASVMVAHLNIPALDTMPNRASTLSKPIITDLLKGELGFKGLVVTDALNMKGVSKYYKPGIIEVEAVKAGNDLLLMPDNVPLAISSIMKAIEKGEIDERLINESCKKILAAKYWVGLNRNKQVDLKNLHKDLNSTYYELTYRDLIEKSLTIVRNNDMFVPLKGLDTLKIASVTFGVDKENSFQKTMKLYSNIATYNLPKSPSESQINNLLKELYPYNLVIASIHSTDIRTSRKFGISEETIKTIEKIVKNKKTVLDVFANPYSLNRFDDLDNFESVIVSYEESEIIEELSAQLIFGGVTASGKLPVSINKKYKVGAGEEIFRRSRLKYTIPEEVGVCSEALEKIDSIAIDAIEKRATPGCQVLVAKDGSVFYNKAFGYHTYQNKKQVETTDLYDLASITKIAASVPVLMQMVEEQKLTLDDKIDKFLPELDTTNKKDLIVGDILTHQARLEPWIPFYYETLDKLFPDKDLFSSRISDDYPYQLGKRFYMTKHIKLNDSIYAKHFSWQYPTKVSDNLYISRSYQDSIYQKIYSSELLRRKKYKYSDLGYYLFFKIIEKEYEKPLQEIVEDEFYKPLGASTLGYNPLKKFNLYEIVPTENDLTFRKTLVHGYVHDPGAAMLGGVCCHAGLFSNANDLAKLMQMYLQGGVYGEKRYFSEETLNLFTTAPHVKENNRRAYGFDKPKLENHKYGPTCDNISPKSYGHTGFTGTIAWADPEENIIYIFLSNRIHPDANNSKLIDMDVRTKIQEAIYASLHTYSN